MDHSLEQLISRRRLLKNATVATAAVLAMKPAQSKAAPRISEIDLQVISKEEHYYHGWPTVARRKNGQLMVVCSGGRQGHVCPFGRVEYMTSDDEGQSWTWPRVLLDGAIDDRDAGVMETAKGTILVTTFTSLAYADNKGQMQSNQSWQAVHRRTPEGKHKAQLGEWMLRSTDGGISWSAPYATMVNSPHGPLQLADGRLLYPGKELWTQAQRIGVCESTDDGQNWRWLSGIPIRPGDHVEGYHELHGVETADGRIIVQIRNENKNSCGETLQTQSNDGGKSWSVPRTIGVWGLPSHVLRLRNDNLLMTYGYRRVPFGNQARLSTDHGRTWSEPLTISDDGPGGDLGYPSTVELTDGTLLSVWYEVRKGSSRAVLRQARWKLES